MIVCAQDSAHGLGRRPPEQRLGGRIPIRDQPVGVHAHVRLVGYVENRAKPLLRAARGLEGTGGCRLDTRARDQVGVALVLHERRHGHREPHLAARQPRVLLVMHLRAQLQSLRALSLEQVGFAARSSLRDRKAAKGAGVKLGEGHIGAICGERHETPVRTGPRDQHEIRAFFEESRELRLGQFGQRRAKVPERCLENGA